VEYHVKHAALIYVHAKAHLSDVNRQAGSIPMGAATPYFDARGLQNPWSMFNAGSH
jgi:hypothetical protein